MDRNRQFLVNLLSLAIRNQSFDQVIDPDIDWKVVYEEAYAHQVHTLIYPVIKNITSTNGPSIDLLSLWQSVTVTIAINQIRHIKQISEVFKKFEDEVPVIALKGLIIRQYYPQPNLRTMGDADILIHKEDYERTRSLLTQIGYHEGPSTPKHTSFYHSLFPSIEVHWTLLSNKSFQNFEHFNEDIWKNAISTSIFYTPALTLSAEDQILHLLLHMAGHMRKLGFGLRQLCDIVLYIETNKDILNWQLVNEKVNHYGIGQFTGVIFSLCNKLFHLETPPLFNNNLLEDDFFIDLMITDIFDGGVFGKRNPEREVFSSLFQYVDGRASGYTAGNKSRKFFPIIFPSPKKLSSKYRYAQMLPLLLPFAWLHRLVDNLFRKGSITNLITTYEVCSDPSLEKRFKLLRWLELQ